MSGHQIARYPVRLSVLEMACTKVTQVTFVLGPKVYMVSQVRESYKCVDGICHLAMGLSDKKVAVESKAPCFSNGLAMRVDTRPSFMTLAVFPRTLFRWW